MKKTFVYDKIYENKQGFHVVNITNIYDYIVKQNYDITCIRFYLNKEISYNDDSMTGIYVSYEIRSHNTEIEIHRIYNMYAIYNNIFEMYFYNMSEILRDKLYYDNVDTFTILISNLVHLKYKPIKIEIVIQQTPYRLIYEHNYYDYNKCDELINIEYYLNTTIDELDKHLTHTYDFNKNDVNKFLTQKKRNNGVEIYFYRY